MSTGRARLAIGGRLASLLAVLPLLVPGSAGCTRSDDPEDGVVETAHLRITTTTGNPICAGTPVLLESELARIAEALELPLWSEDDKLDVRFGVDAVAEICAPIFEGGDLAQGCVTSASGERVLAAQELAYTAPHELVHAIRQHNRVSSAIVFEEGLAQVLSASAGFPLYVTYPHGDSSVGPVELLEVPREEFDIGLYVIAQSFVSWLWQTHGRSALMSFMNDPRLPDDDMVLAAFEEHFGQTLPQAEQAWRSDDRPDPTWGAPCIPERTYSLADGPVEISGDYDCHEATIYGGSYFMSPWPMCLDVPETTRVRLSLDAEHGRLSVQSHEPCDPGPVGGEALRDKYLEAGEVLEEDIAGCRYRMVLNSQEPGFPATPYTIRIEEIDG